MVVSRISSSSWLAAILAFVISRFASLAALDNYGNTGRATVIEAAADNDTVAGYVQGNNQIYRAGRV